MNEKDTRQKAYAEGYEQGKFDSRVEAEVSEDAISREWAINKQREMIDLYTPHKTIDGRGQVYWQIEERKLVAKELEQAPSVIPTSPIWTSCSEKLPEPETEVLVSFSDGTVSSLWQKWAVSDGGNYPGEPLAYVMDGYFPETAEEWEKYKIYAEAWMPLPAPYEEDK